MPDSAALLSAALLSAALLERDDYSDQHFQPPETIRKASLFGCDLRGAKIEGVDFYLVDLRKAKYDPEQRDQLIATGAILDEDVRG